MDPKKIVQFVVLLVVILTTAQNTFSQSTLEEARQFAEAINSPKNVVKALMSVPLIGVVVPRLDYPFFDGVYGSAVIVSGGTGNTHFVFTAAHVFPPNLALICAKDSKVTVYFHNNNNFAGRVVYLNKIYDLAIVSFESSGANLLPSLKIAEKDPKIGEELFAIGYPPVNGSLVTVSKLNFRGVDVSTGQIKIDSHTFTPLEVQNFLLSMSVERGYSGGPLLNKNGEIEGIIVQVSKHGTFAFALARKHLLHALSVVQSGQEFCKY